MANPAVFTSGDIGGGAPKTGLRGPLLVGYSTADPGGQTISATVSPGGSAAAPLYSFVAASGMGIYASVLTTGANQARVSAIGADVWGWSTAGLGVVCTSAATVSGSFSTAGTSVGMYIPQSTGALVSSSAGTTGVSFNGNACLVWDNVNFRLQVFSTVAGEWLRMPAAAAFTSS